MAKKPMSDEEKNEKEVRKAMLLAKLIENASSNEDKSAVLKSMVQGAYDLQKLRIQTGLRVVSAFKYKLGIMPGQKEKSEKPDETEKLTEEILKILREEYDLITNGIVENKDQDFIKSLFSNNRLIADTAEFALVGSYIKLIKQEKTMFRDIEEYLENFPIYTEFLKGVKGCGPAMSGVIISTINIHKATYRSSLEAYAGIDVALDGRGRSKRQEHLIERSYTNKDNKLAVKKGITFNPFLKTKLLGVLAPGFLKARNERYCKVFYDYRTRIENRPLKEGQEPLTKLHIYNMSIRRTAKIFLHDLYEKWRELEGLPVYRPYEEEKLGMKPHREGAVRNNIPPEFDTDLGFDT